MEAGHRASSVLPAISFAIPSGATAAAAGVQAAAGSELIVGTAVWMAPAGATSLPQIAQSALAPLILRLLRPAVVAAVTLPPHHPPRRPLRRPLRPRLRLAADAADSKRIAETVAKMALGGAMSQQTIVRNALAPSIQVPPIRAAAAAACLRLRLSQLRPLRIQDPRHLLRRVQW
jgi:hypothetical protein